MCNVAGYVGKKDAAPILLEMMKFQEGFGGGYYSGIATIDNGKLYYDKVVGDIATLYRETDARNFPGKIGIIHSRSKSGGDREWGHPFVDCQEKIAYIANGHEGMYRQYHNKSEVAQKLEASGHVFKAKSSVSLADYHDPEAHPVLADGSHLHISEVSCHLIESLLEEFGTPLEAVYKTAMVFPAEIVNLVLHTSNADRIITTRFNQPLMIARDCDGTYLSTTAMAFPKKMDWLSAMPTNTVAAVFTDRLELRPLNPPPVPVAQVLPWDEGVKVMLDLLSNNDDCGLQDFKNATASLWPPAYVPQKDMMVYEIMRLLKNRSTIDFRNACVDGVSSCTNAPTKRAFLLD